MLAVGLELDTHRIPDIVRRKLPLPGLLLGQILLLPAIAVLIVRAVPMPDSTKFVVLMLAACPTGNIANFFTLLARGDLALSVSGQCHFLFAGAHHDACDVRDLPSVCWAWGSRLWFRPGHC